VGVTALTTRDFAEIAAQVRTAAAVVAVGSGTHSGLGGAVPADTTVVSAPAGIVDFEPADMTVTVLAGTTCAELDDTLAAHGQECPLDPADGRASVGGVLAAGLSGRRRLGLGPVRDTVLEVVLVLADGRVVRGGGPTVKNVTGYDVPRLVVGSLGTLGVIVRVTLRTRPRPRASEWFTAPRDRASAIRSALFAPMTVLESRHGTAVLLEGHPDDLVAEAAHAELVPGPDVAPEPPMGAHRGRISLPPTRLDAAVPELDAEPGLDWLAEHGVGTVHVATDDPARLGWAREIAAHHGGWLLREAGAPDLDPFGAAGTAAALHSRIRDAFDPTRKLAPGRIPA
jgi:glycolate oxidase FAD binding subunit